MVEKNNDKRLSELLKAMGDTTRRSLLTRLVQEGACRVTDLSQLYEMSLNAISKHLKVLEKAHLITRNKVGRIHWIEADLTQVALVESWFSELKSIFSLATSSLYSFTALAGSIATSAFSKNSFFQFCRFFGLILFALAISFRVFSSFRISSTNLVFNCVEYLVIFLLISLPSYFIV